MDLVYNVEVVMKPEFSNWHPNAKKRYTDFSVRGATDYTQGNVDYNFHIISYTARTYYGEVILRVPEKYRTLGGYYKDYTKMGADWLKGAAIDAVREELKISFGSLFQRAVQSVHVTKAR